MPTLSNVASKGRLVFKIVGVLFLIFLLVQFSKFVKNQLFPPPKPPPTVAFGKLPNIDFPKTISSEKFTYSIDTLTGNLPTFPDRISVYKIKSVKPDILAFERIKNALFTLGFEKQATLVSDNSYEWQDKKSMLSRRITIDIFSSDFSLTSAFLSLTDNQLDKIDKNNALKTAKDFLQTLSSLPSDIDEEKTKIVLFLKKNRTLSPVSNSSDATDIKLDFFQKDIDKLPIYYLHPQQSIMNFIVESVGNNSQVVQGDFIHQEILNDESATYPIKTAQQALSDLQKGKAYVASSSKDIKEVKILDVMLAYFLGEKRQVYLLPIIVFQGDNDFTAYTQALTDEWLSN